jgi:uncharacterized protein (TIGR04222 family)
MYLEEPMTRKLSFTIILVLLASLFVTIPALAAKSYYAERFDVQIDIQENGSAIVTETVEFHFSGDPFTYAFREISATNTDGLTFLDASMDGAAMPQGTQAGQVEVEAGNPLKVTWHFSPTPDAAHVFTVRYRAEGVIRKGDADTLIWRAIPEDHDYSINRSTITLTYPSKVTPLEQPTLDWNHDTRWEEDRIILTTSGISPDEDLILTARFPLKSLTTAAPQWQVQQEQMDAATSKALPFGVGAGIATLILGALGLFSYARANGRELGISPIVSTANPPSDVAPAIIGKLTGQQHTFMGAIFDLAQRGVLEVQEEKGFWGAKNHVLVRKDFIVALKPFEQGLMDALFKTSESQINMNEVGTRLASKNKLFDEPLQQELIQRGWLDGERKQKRTWLLGLGVMTMIFALIVIIISLFSGGASILGNPNWLPWIAGLVGISLGVFILSIALLIYGATYSTLTPAGEEQSARWQGFAEYIKQVSKGWEPATRPDYFEKYLAYAAVFGLGAGWAKYFQELGGVPLPVWFHAMAGSDGDFGAMVTVMSASDTAGVSGGADGGGGASGGGSSGAG